jgi:hypothetical protein
MGIFSKADRDKAEAALYATSPSLFGKAVTAPSWRNGTAPAPRMAAAGDDEAQSIGDRS